MDSLCSAAIKLLLGLVYARAHLTSICGQTLPHNAAAVADQVLLLLDSAARRSLRLAGGTSALAAADGSTRRLVVPSGHRSLATAAPRFSRVTDLEVRSTGDADAALDALVAALPLFPRAPDGLVINAACVSNGRLSALGCVDFSTLPRLQDLRSLELRLRAGVGPDQGDALLAACARMARLQRLVLALDVPLLLCSFASGGAHTLDDGGGATGDMDSQRLRQVPQDLWPELEVCLARGWTCVCNACVPWR